VGLRCCSSVQVARRHVVIFTDGANILVELCDHSGYAERVRGLATIRRVVTCQRCFVVGAGTFPEWSRGIHCCFRIRRRRLKSWQSGEGCKASLAIQSAIPRMTHALASSHHSFARVLVVGHCCVLLLGNLESQTNAPLDHPLPIGDLWARRSWCCRDQRATARGGWSPTNRPPRNTPCASATYHSFEN
jgi:hypothetical protein